VLGEEGTDRPGTSGIRWIVDPLDGTVNYLYRYPAHAVSIAAELDDQVVVGVVIDSALDITYSAVLGRGAVCDGARLVPRHGSRGPAPLVATGFGYDSDQRREQGRVLAQIISDVRDIRRGGSAAIDLCSAASGQVDAYFEQGPNEWDVAAGLLICRETGLRTGWDPRAKFVVAAPPGTYEELNRLLTSADARVGTAFERGTR
jgi:myo-inositol-1(or 4)-monophosphatase